MIIRRTKLKTIIFTTQLLPSVSSMSILTALVISAEPSPYLIAETSFSLFGKAPSGGEGPGGT